MKLEFIYFISYSFIILTCSCSYQTNIIQTSGSLAKSGEELINSITSFYTYLNVIGTTDSIEENSIGILLHSGNINNYRPVKAEVFQNQLKPRLAAYEALKKVYTAIDLLSNNDNTDKVKTASSALVSAIDSIKRIPQLPSEVQNSISQTTSFIITSIRAKKLKEANKIVLMLVKIYYELWKSDSKIWKEAMNQYSRTQINNINSLPDSIFDFAKLIKSNKKPFILKKELLIRTYKEASIRDIVIRKANFYSEVDKETSAFKKLINSHIELTKIKPNISIIISNILDIAQIVKNIKLI